MSKLSPCGFDCHACEAYIATTMNITAMLRNHQIAYKEQFGKSISLEELKCEGCMADGLKISFCSECEIRKCAISRSFANCAYCPDFPCKKGEHIWADGAESLKNLKALRDSLR